MTRLRQETPLTSRVESALAKATQQQNASIEQTLFGQVARQHEFLKSLEVAIKEQIETTMPRLIQEMIEPLTYQLRMDANQIDSLIKDNLTRQLSSQEMRDILATAATTATKPALEFAFKEAFSNILMPGMEKACQNMFKQVQDAFLMGTRECE